MVVANKYMFGWSRMVGVGPKLVDQSGVKTFLAHGETQDGSVAMLLPVDGGRVVVGSDEHVKEDVLEPREILRIWEHRDKKLPVAGLEADVDN